MPMHHPIFSRFSPYAGPQRAGYWIDFSGAEFSDQWTMRKHAPAAPAMPQPLPSYNEEYFEWVDLLESIHTARDRFVMFELGAGFGRWGVRGGKLAKQCGVVPTLILVEALPQHAEYARAALTLNELAQNGIVIERAVAYTGEPASFLVEHETVDIGYGQCLAWDGAEASGYKSVHVETSNFEELTAGYDFIDLVDMDLQRAEREVIANSMETLNQKVRRVHIGTHRPDIEAAMRNAFRTAGWRCVWDFECNRVNETPFGTISFVDGVQGWVNPRLS